MAPRIIRNLLRVEMLRRSLRDKTMHAIAEATLPYHREQLDRLKHLEKELASTRADAKTRTHELHDRMRDLHDRLIEFEVRSRHDIVYQADRQAAAEAAQFVSEQFNGPHFASSEETLEYALSLAPAGGLALEFGVYTGGTLRIIAAKRGDGRVYGFDSFKGLPEDWRNGFPVGTFALDGLPDVPGAQLVPGWFDDTLPGFLAAHDGPVDFVHIDGDLYSSAKTVLDLVGPRLQPGSVLVFDEFMNFPGWREHEYRAWQEYVERTGTKFQYEGYCYCDQQVIVRIS